MVTLFGFHFRGMASSGSSSLGIVSSRFSSRHNASLVFYSDRFASLEPHFANINFSLPVSLQIGLST